VEERARRRYRELQARGVPAVDYGEILATMRRRDHIDSTRAAAPLRAAPDAYLLDSTNLTIEQVLERMLALVYGKPLPEDGTVRRAASQPAS